jgi:iron complex transport system substrate-binding protein
MMDALEIDLVGIPASSKQLPERYQGVTKVGNPMSPDMELIKSLNPTEVLSVTTLEYDLAPAFASAGIDATFLDLTSLDSMMNEIKALGEKYNKQEQAEALITRYHQKIAEISRAIEGRPSPTVLILLGVPGSYLVATENSYIGSLVKIAGGVNIVQNEDVEYLASNTEYLQQANPDVILRAAHGMPEEVIKMFDREFKVNDIWKHFSAVQNGRVYDLEERLFGTTANLYAVEALDVLMEMLYPQ